MASEPSVAAEAAKVLDKGAPLAERMRAVFHLRTAGGPVAVETLASAVEDMEGSCLFRHEVAFVLGQMGDAAAVPCLTRILENVEDDAIVRHECAEALGAIAQPESLDVLKKFMEDPAKEVSETCAIAVQRMTASGPEAKAPESSPFDTVDPAPAEEGAKSVAELREALLDEEAPLFARYKAMFALRNDGSDEAVLALCDGLQDTSSALFRHEVAYVLGQLERGLAADALTACLLRGAEHAMVRHEAAEALGAIGTPAVMAVLKEHLQDKDQVVRESCEVALDAAAYWADVAAASGDPDAPTETAQA
ncbi:DOHH [Symbiodinium sp. KB8]|nr:DOHH [Symbiodinium sp. KB8]